MTAPHTFPRKMDPKLVVQERAPDEEHAPKKAHDLGFELPPPAKVSHGRVIVIGSAVLAVLAGIFAASYLPMRRDRQTLVTAAQGEGAKSTRVEVVKPTIAASQHSLTLPGSVRALEETVVYSRASGYVRKWHFDIGAKVKEGDLLAEIDTPEVDQQIVQARAQLAQAEAGLVLARANSGFSKQNLVRYQKLAPAGVASQEEFEKARAQADVDEANVTVSQANVEAQRANLQRLLQLKSFGRVVAPFGGTITERTIGRGALVTAGNSSPLFRLSSVDPARVFVQVPQDVAPSVTVGSTAKVKVREFPGHDFEGHLAHSAGALDSATRTMTIEVRVPNPEGQLLAGMYAEVALSLPTPHRVFTLPATALLNDAKGLRVAVVGSDSRIRWTPVVLERDTGSTIEIATGIDDSTQIVKLASADLADGQIVEVAK
ncbi:MAG: efflux RND transporter periplasmic adaptor subunit [Polyangiaceae bacterium]